jgi:NitT/TauT family transport system substrate-binding protein
MFGSVRIARLVTYAATVAALGFIVACGSDEDADGGSAAGGGEPKTLRVAVASTPDFTQIALVKWQEDLEAAGVKVELKNVEATDVALRTVVSGQADVYVGSLALAAQLVESTDAAVKMLAADAQATDYILLAQPEIKALDDLTGKKIGINRPGDEGGAFTQAALRKEGFDIDDAEFLSVGGTSARVAALLSGQIDAAPAHAAEAFEAAAEGPHPLLVLSESLGPVLQTGLVASQEWIDADSEHAQQIVDAFLDSSRWAAENEAEYIERSKEVVPDLSDESRDKAYQTLTDIDLFAVNGGVSEEQVEAFADTHTDAGTLPNGAPEYSRWVDPSFVEDYLERNGEL